MTLKCFIDMSYNVNFEKIPSGIPTGHRNKPYAAVNNLCQGLYTVEFLKLALPTLPLHCEKFGISLKNNGVYIVSNKKLLDQWRDFTGANPSEFWLLNSFLLENANHPRPIKLLKEYMEPTRDNDKYMVAEIPQYRKNVKRTFVFKSWLTPYLIPWFNEHPQRYYRGLDLKQEIFLKDVLHFLRRNKKCAMFFRQVELP